MPPIRQSTTKVCRSCGLEMPFSAFSTNGNPKDRVTTAYRPKCRSCDAKANREAPKDPAVEERRRASKRQAYWLNRESNIAKSSAWQKANRERINIRNRLTAKARRETNVENARKKGRRDQLARRIGRDPQSMEYAAILLRDPCSYCGGPATTIDHIEPLRAGGLSAWDNLTASCAPCNSTKRDHPLLFFLGVQADYWNAVRPGYWSAREGAAPSAPKESAP
jgi:hypothetical protein